ncbi:hypothetical protein [Phnomibacter sp. MR]|uniref:hypothetical protein n=1 Tax=Phnomibacter sp. MR TaxID=3042318 RepID=UPI003A80D0AE
MVISKLIPASLCCLLSLASLSLQAQDTNEGSDRKSRQAKQQARRDKVNQMAKAEEEGAIIYHKEWVLGGKLYNDGLAAHFQKAKMKTNYKSNWYLVEVGVRKANNEYKIGSEDVSIGFALTRPYIYAKQNVFMQTKIGFGQQYLIGGKGNKNGVAVMAIYGGGLSLGLLKPYYIEKFDAANNELVKINWQGGTNRTDTLFLDQTVQGTSAGFFKGFSDLKFRPGVFAKTGLRFDYGRYNEMVSAIECGVNVEFYAQEMPIMVDNPAKRFFANIYVGIEFGRRK